MNYFIHMKQKGYEMMNPKQETWKTRNTIRKKGVEALKKQYVKAELMNYHYYKECWSQLHERIQERTEDYEARLNDPLKSCTAISVSAHSNTHTPWQIEKTSEIIQFQERLQLYEQQLANIDMWLSVLSQTQQEAVIAYIIERQCSQLEQAAHQLSRSAEAIQKAADRAIIKIVRLFL